jgi:hypothetical protein
MERILSRHTSSHLSSVWISSANVHCDTHALQQTYGGGCFLVWRIMEATKQEKPGEQKNLLNFCEMDGGEGTQDLLWVPELLFGVTV